MENDRTKQDLENLKSRLLVKRNDIGAETPLGYHLSNLIEQMRNYARETDPTARAHLERFMGWSVEAIARTA